MTTLKTVSMYLRAAKTEAEDAGESTEGMASSVSELREELLKLTNGKVDIQLDENTFKSTYQILKELSEVWDSLTDITQANITEMVGGKRNANVVSALLENFSIAEEALETSAGAAGSAMAENEKYLDSVQGKIDVMKASFEALSTNIMSSDVLGFFIDIGTGLLNIINILEQLHLLLPMITSSIVLIKGVGIAKSISESTAKVATLTTSLIAEKSATDTLATSVASLTVAEKAKLATNIQSAVASGQLTAQEGAQILSTLGLATAEGTLTVANTSLATSFKSLMASIPVWGWIALGISVAIEAVTALTSATSQSKNELRELANEVTDTYNQEKSSLESTKETLDDISDRYIELSKGVNDLGKNVSLSSDEYEEYKTIVSQVADMFPAMIQGYNDEGLAILTCKDDVEALTKAYQDLVKASNDSVLSDATSLFKDFQNSRNDIEDGNFKNTKLTDDAIEALKNVLNSEDLDEAINQYLRTGTTNVVEVVQALKDAGIEQNGGTWYKLWTDAETGHDFIKRAIQENRPVVESIIGNFENDMSEATDGMRSITSAYISNALLGAYSDISPALQSVISNIVSGFDYGFYSQFDSLNDLYNYLSTLLNQFHGLGDDDTKVLTTAFDLKTSYNNGECTLGEYIDTLNNAQDIISGFDEDTQNAFKILLDLDDDGIAKKYNSLLDKLGEGNKDWLDSLSVDDFNLLYQISLDCDTAKWELFDWQEKLQEYQLAAEAVSENVADSFSKQLESVEKFISGISAAQDAVNSQQTGKSVSLADFSSDELVEYRSALEYVNGTMQLNAEKVKEIAQAKADEQVAINNNNKALEQTKYLENAKQIEKYREQLRNASYAEGESAESIQESIDALLSENSSIAAACDQYDLLSASVQEAVGAYQNWLNAQSASDYGDMADDAVSAIQRIRDTYDQNSDIYGDYGSKKFDAAVEFIVPDSVNADDLDAIEKYMADFKKYLTFDDDGVVEGLDIDKFLNDSVTAGLMSYSDDDGFEVLGGKKMEDFAKGLNLSSGVVQAFFDKLQLKGGEFSWVDEADKTIGDLAVSANVAAENLRALHSDMSITLDVTDLESAEEKTEALDATIKQMQDLKTTVDVDAEEVEYANSIISYCITQKHQLNEPAILNVDVSKVSETTSEAVSLVQEFQRACNDLELKKALGLDTTDAQSKVDELYAKISSSENDALLALKLDTTSVETVKSSIANLDIEDIKTSLQIDDTALLDYQTEDKDATVTYHLNSTEVDGYNPENLSRSVTYYVETVGSVKLNGTANLAGTSHAGGTAKAGGDWGTAPGGQTLVGELGREIVVDPRTGQWYTVGDNGAEFRDIPAGAIVFNHKQTESLLANGYVAGRASALVNGTALVTGRYKPYKASDSSTTRKSSTSKKSSSSSSKSNSSSKSSDDKDDSEIIDWIEIAIDRIERAIDRLATVATSPFRKLAERISATNDELSQMSYELSLQQSAYDRYMQQASSVGLSSDLASKVQNGTIDITEYDGDTADKIKDYQKWYEKMLDCKDAILELSESIAELYQNKFDDVATDYENKLSLLEHVTNAYNNGIDDLEERGYLASTKYYEALSNVEKQNIDIQKQELAALTKAMSEAVNSGSIKEGSEAWYEFQQQINEVKESIQESETSLVEFANTIREIKWERFDYLQEQISNITEEADFLIDLMENSDLYTDNGQLTDTGMATMGLHGQNYNVYMAQADKYAEELLALNKEIAEDPNNTKLLERREELLESQRDSILAAEDEKQAIIDMVREGIELELDSLRELIDTYTESLDSAKDLYDYQKKVKQQTAEIASLQKQLSAYSGDTSEETRATMQKLQVDLSDAMESLEETQYDHYISEQKKLLDNLYDEYEMILNERLDNVDALLSDMIDSINTNSASISDTLLTQAEKVGYTISENEKAIWSNEGGANSIITKYGEAFNTQMTTVNDVISKIAIKIGAMATESDKKAETTIKETTPSTKTDTTVKPQTTTNTKKNNTNANSTKFNEDVKRGVAAAIWIYGSKSGWGNDPDRNKRLTAKFGATNAKAVQSYINAHANNGDLYKYWVSTGRSKLSQYYYSAFKKGGLADYTGVAWLDGTPQEPEMVLNPEDTKNFIALKDAMRSVADGDSPLSELFGNGDSSSNILQQLAKIESPMTASGTNVGDITYQITIPIDHVQDYNDFMNQMRKDGKFEKFIKSVTVDRLTGGSKIAKNKYQW